MYLLYNLFMKYIIFVIDRASATGTKEERIAVDVFNDKLIANGNWVIAAGIAAPQNAIVIDNRKGVGLKTTGSLFRDQEHYSGFWVIEAADAADAEQLAFEGSAACNRRVELRPYLH